MKRLFALLALLLLAGCTYEMNPDQVARSHRACDDKSGLAYVKVDPSENRVISHCRNGETVVVKRTP